MTLEIVFSVFGAILLGAALFNGGKIGTYIDIPKLSYF